MAVACNTGEEIDAELHPDVRTAIKKRHRKIGNLTFIAFTRKIISEKRIAQVVCARCG
jgi:hypothetical protein